MSDTGSVFKVQQFIDSSQLKSDLAYSPTDLTNAMMNQSAMFAHYGVEAAKAARQVDVVKLLLEQTEAAVYRKIRDDLTVKGEKTTEALLDKLVSRNEKVLALKRALTEAKQIEALGKTAVEAFRHRRDMLIQHGLISREEMKGELTIAQRSVNEQVLDHHKQTILARRASRLANQEDA